MILLADSEGPDQTAHLNSLIWAFTVYTSQRHIFTWWGSYDDSEE